MVERAFAAAQRGATDQEIAETLGVSERTFYSWCHEHPEFLQATKVGKEAADQRVERSLYRRALGYSHESVKIFMPAGAKYPVYAPFTEHYPPDTQAASLWLRNRQPEKWRDKTEVEHSGTVGLADRLVKARERARSKA